MRTSISVYIGGDPKVTANHSPARSHAYGSDRSLEVPESVHLSIDDHADTEVSLWGPPAELRALLVAALSAVDEALDGADGGES